MPAEAGIQSEPSLSSSFKPWTPVFTGVTDLFGALLLHPHRAPDELTMDAGGGARIGSNSKSRADIPALVSIQREDCPQCPQPTEIT